MLGNWTLTSHYKKINSVWIKDLSVGPQTVKLLGEIIGHGFVNDFLDVTPKAQATKEK